MTRPTIDDVRAEPAGRRLDGWLHESMGKVVNWRYGHPFSDEVGLLGWNMVPAYSTDPAACAELRRHLWTSGQYDSFAQCSDEYTGTRRYLVHLEWGNGRGYAFLEHAEPIGTDPIATECLCWAKVALIAELSKGVE